MSLLPLAKATDYVKYGAKYKLSGLQFLVLPGVISSNPEVGAVRYNNNLISRLRKVNSKGGSTIRFSGNKRYKKIKNIIESTDTINATNFTKLELVLLFELLCDEITVD